MNANWEQVQSVFHQALDVPPEERAPFLERVCAGDADMRAEVESLLAHDGGREEIASAVHSAVQSLFEEAPIKPGTTIGDYEILKLIGSGGMGEVYEAKDSRLARHVAIKILPASFTMDPGRLRRFQQEAQAAAALNHPNILTVYQMGFQARMPYIISELLEGCNLRERMKAGPLPLSDVVEYGVQVARGLAAAHGKGITHRDLKPENLFVTNNGQVKILDFGLAKFSRPSHSGQSVSITETGLVVGTASYMSPEQVRGQEVDSRTDFFSVGAVLYEMVSGQRAFAKPTAAETMTAILHEKPPSLSQLSPTSVPALERIVSRCLEKNPDQRFQSASDLAFALETVSVEPRSDSANRPRPVKNAAQGRVRSGLRLSLMVAVAAFAVLGLAYRFRPTAPTPRVSRIEPLTRNSFAGHGEPLFAVGPWLYYASGGPIGVDAQLRQVLLNGSQDSPSGIPGRFRVRGLSPDDTEFVAYDRAQSTVWRIPLGGGSPQRVGDLLANEIAWSHDGNFFAYAQGNQLFVANVDGTSSRLLATLPGVGTGVDLRRFALSSAYSGPQVDHLRWSPDDRRLRFTFLNEPVEALWEVGADGGNLRELRFNWPGNPAECCGEWTPDGRYFVFRSSRGGISNLWALEEKTDWWHRPNRDPVQLTSGPLDFDEPLPSRNGKSIFAVGSQPYGELVRYDGLRKVFVPFLEGHSLSHLAFSPDGKWLAYVSYSDKTLWRARRDGTEALQLTFPSLGRVLCPRWSADSREIAFFTRQAGKLSKSFVISADGGKPEAFPAEEFSQSVPDWLPGQNALVYSREYRAADPALYRFERTTGRSEKIPGADGLYGPLWSPDGRYLAALEGGTDNLLLVDLKSGKRTQIAGPATWPSWSPDSQSIYFIRWGNNWITRVGIADKREEKFLEFPFRLAAWPFTVAPDGSLILLREHGNRDVYSLSLSFQ